MAKIPKRIPKKPPTNWWELVIWLILTLGAPAAAKAIEKIIEWLSKKDLKKLLAKLDKLKEEGKVSDQEYARIREKIIAEGEVG